MSQETATSLTDLQTKVCSSCKTRKPHFDFHRAARQPDGRQCYCKECNKSYMKSYWQTPSGRDADNRRNQDPMRKAKQAVRRILNRAVAAGSIPRIQTQKCACGEQAIHYHHPRLDQPLNVQPVCGKCHYQIHH